jgi:CRP/FNR family cyclic AMP-dependent transcriptional regulator
MTRSFNAQAFLNSSGVGTTVREYRRDETVFRQGDREGHVLYVRTGGVQLSMRSSAGREVPMGMAGPGDFFGEGGLGGQRIRTSSATAITPSVIMRIGQRRMAGLLHHQRGMSDRFIVHMLSRNLRIEEDLAEQRAGDVPAPRGRVQL